jgi:hypothetical protein
MEKVNSIDLLAKQPRNRTIAQITRFMTTQRAKPGFPAPCPQPFPANLPKLHWPAARTLPPVRPTGTQNTNNNTMATQNTTQTAAVRITSSCLVNGLHLQEGLCYEMSGPLAMDLETASRAEILRIRPSQSAPAFPELIAAPTPAAA